MVLNMIASTVDMRKAVMHEVAYKVVDHAIERVPSIFTTSNETKPTQHREVLARDCLRDVERAREVANAQLVMGERVNDRDSQGIRKCLEYLHCIREHDCVGTASTGNSDASSIKNIRQLQGLPLQGRDALRL